MSNNRYYINVSGYEDEIGLIYEYTDYCKILERIENVSDGDIILYEWHTDSFNTRNKAWYKKIDKSDYFMLKRLSWLAEKGEVDTGYYEAVVHDIIRIALDNYKMEWNWEKEFD